jgi:hypothetical protein
LPEDSAPPRPVKLWHDAQLSRNSSPPRAVSGPLSAKFASFGVVGPPPLAWMNAPRAARLAAPSSVSGLNTGSGGLRLACASWRAIGIRPDETWK